MLNRKTTKAPKHSRRDRERAKKTRPVRRRFIISSSANHHQHAKTAKPADKHKQNGHSKNGHPKVPPPPPKALQKPLKPLKGQKGQKAPAQPEQAAGAAAPGTVDLTETIKTLLHLAQENGYVTYDDINDILPDNLSPDDLDELYTKLRTLEVEIVDQAEVERAKPAAAPEEDEDARLEILDDPVRMYMNQMGKVPLLTREQEVEICKKIE